MKVILLRDVPKIGRKYEAKEVSDGYARNLLFPKGWAEAATPDRLKHYEKAVLADKAKREDEREALKSSILSLSSLSEGEISLAARADERGHLFKKLRAEDVKRLIKDTKGIEIPEECIMLDAPITSVGVHPVPLQFDGTKAIVVVTITAA